MAHTITFDLRKGTGVPEAFLMGSVEIEPTAMHTSGTALVFPAPIAVPITDGTASVDLDPSPAGEDPAWAYRIVVRETKTKRAWSEIVRVPDVAGPTAYTALERLSTSTSAPPLTTWGEIVAEAAASATAAQDAQAAAEAAAGLVGAPAGAAVLAAVSEGGAARSELNAAIDTAIPAQGLVIPDFINSWWTNPRCTYDAIRRRVYVGGVTRGGAPQVGIFHLGPHKTERTLLATLKRVPDDHNAPALQFDGNAVPMVAYSYHGEDGTMRWRRGITPGDIDLLQAEQTFNWAGVVTGAQVSYAALIPKANDSQVLAIVARVDNTIGGAGEPGWRAIRSNDGGATFGTETRLTARRYVHTRRTGTDLFVWGVEHATTIPQLFHAARIDLNTGAAYNLTGTATGTNLFTSPTGTVILPTANVTSIGSHNGPTGMRLFDIAPDGRSGVIGEFTPGDRTSMVYKVIRYGGTNTPTYETLTGAGVPFGYEVNFYNSGAVFKDGNTIILGRENAGTWTVERWTRSGTTWSLNKVLYTAAPGYKIGRPQVPAGAEGTNLVTFGLYSRYTADSFQDYYADQILIDAA